MTADRPADSATDSATESAAEPAADSAADRPALRRESLVVEAGRPPRDPGAPLNTSIVLSATFHATADHNAYLRQDSSDTVRAFETALGRLEGGTALAFASGMAATTAVVEGQPAGTIAVAPRAVYSGTSAVFREQQRLGRLQVRYVDVTDTAATIAALPGASLLWLESPTNPLLGVADLPSLIAAAHAHGATVALDSTFNSPMVLRPLEYGADIVMHSATKYLAGHSDLLMGALVTADPQLGAALRTRRDLTGAVPGALESFLALRGIRTLALRMERAQANAHELARRLAAHPQVLRVRYPGLPDDPGHQRAARLHDGFGAMLCFEVGDEQIADRICRAVRLVTHATSLGGVETLIERRGRYDLDAANGTPPNLLRLSVGIEAVEDLWADLCAAIAAGCAPTT